MELEKNYRELGIAVVRQAIKDYFGINKTISPTPNKAQKRAILKELRSDWDDFITGGLSLMVADQLEKNPKEIKQRLINAEKEMEELECQNTVQHQAM